MSTSTFLGMTLLANGLANYVLANEYFDTLEKASSGRITVDFTSDADLTLTADQGFHKVLAITDSTVALTTGRDVIFPTKGPERIIKNSTAQTLTLKITGQTGVAILASTVGRYYYDGTDIVAAP